MSNKIVHTDGNTTNISIIRAGKIYESIHIEHATPGVVTKMVKKYYRDGIVKKTTRVNYLKGYKSTSFNGTKTRRNIEDGKLHYGEKPSIQAPGRQIWIENRTVRKIDLENQVIHIGDEQIIRQFPSGDYTKHKISGGCEGLKPNKIIQKVSEGNHHCVDGPAYKIGAVEKWYIDGKKHRIGAPAVIKTGGLAYLEDRSEYYGAVDIVKYYENGKRHRIGGPAVIKQQGVKYRECWYLDGKEHREGRLPCVTVRFNGNLVKQRWAENGKSVPALPRLVNYERGLITGISTFELFLHSRRMEKKLNKAKELIEHLTYAPGGPGYRQAELEFSQLKE